MTGRAPMAEVAITGIGLVTPLGCAPGEALDRIQRGEKALRPSPLSPPLACPLFAPVMDFDAARYLGDHKTLRLMNRDAQLATVAARLAMQDAGLRAEEASPIAQATCRGDFEIGDACPRGPLYPPEEMALYGSTGLSGIATEEITRLVRESAAPDGSLDLRRFGETALRRIRPVLSFKILANMPLCFVSIFENLRGPNGVYAPWEGNGAQAVAAGVRAVSEGEVPCAVVGGCDVKTHDLALVALEQLGVLDSWRREVSGTVPGEGAAFLVLEERDQAVQRGARVYATVRRQAWGSAASESDLPLVLRGVRSRLGAPPDALVLAAGDGEPAMRNVECAAMAADGVLVDELEHPSHNAPTLLRPKMHLGNLFAGAAAVQIALAAVLAARQASGTPVVANCHGHGTEQAAFLLEAA